MLTTDSSNAPSLIKPALVFAVTAAMLALSSRAPAQEPAPHAYAGEPMVRVRADIRVANPIALADRLAADANMRDRRDAARLVRADIERQARVALAY